MLLGGPGPITINPVIQKSLPYDATKAFSPISLVANVQSVLVVNPSLPVNSVSNLVNLAKRRPGQLSYASAGNGSATHMAGELFKILGGNLQIAHIAYKGGAPSLTDVLAGRVELSFPSLPSAMVHLKSGRLRGIASTGNRRTSTFPEMPTIKESGIPDYEAVMWYGLLAPAGLQKETLLRLSMTITGSLQRSEVREQLILQGADPEGSSAEFFSNLLDKERQKWITVSQLSSISID